MGVWKETWAGNITRLRSDTCTHSLSPAKWMTPKDEWPQIAHRCGGRFCQKELDPISTL